jgi:hypothetical protein
MLQRESGSPKRDHELETIRPANRPMEGEASDRFWQAVARIPCLGHPITIRPQHHNISRGIEIYNHCIQRFQEKIFEWRVLMFCAYDKLDGLFSAGVLPPRILYLTSRR